MSIDRELLGILGVIGALIGLLVVITKKEDDEWTKFLTTHDCIIVGKSEGYTRPLIGTSTNGQITVFIDTVKDTTTWKCSNGVEYSR